MFDLKGNTHVNNTLENMIKKEDFVNTFANPKQVRIHNPVPLQKTTGSIFGNITNQLNINQDTTLLDMMHKPANDMLQKSFRASMRQSKIQSRQEPNRNYQLNQNAPMLAKRGPNNFTNNFNRGERIVNGLHEFSALSQVMKAVKNKPNYQTFNQKFGYKQSNTGSQKTTSNFNNMNYKNMNATNKINMLSIQNKKIYKPKPTLKSMNNTKYPNNIKNRPQNNQSQNNQSQYNQKQNVWSQKMQNNRKIKTLMAQNMMLDKTFGM